MGPKTSYYLILSVYCLLWVCQVVACHLTHSLIILTDSYVNLYKILDVLLGILHLKIQGDLDGSCKQEAQGNVVRLFGSVCTYRFKRLPLLGSFINGSFLAALLMSAAIEGVQTCFHASHSEVPGEKSILLAHKLTYPAVLVGFALVGLIMQWCTRRAHEMRGQKLGSLSLLDVSGGLKGYTLAQLDAAKLQDIAPTGASNPNLVPGDCSGVTFVKVKSFRPESKSNRSNKYTLPTSLPLRPLSVGSAPAGFEESTNISLKSLKVDLNLSESQLDQSEQQNEPFEAMNDSWIYVRFFVSPASLVFCALIVYFVDHEMVTEVLDAGSAIMVVVLLFFASYPPMKKAGKILLQTAPDGLNLDKLKNDLKNISPSIIEVEDLHVWGLTPKTHRVASCHLLLERGGDLSEKQISYIIKEVKRRFLRDNIKCTTIEPRLIEAKSQQGCE